MYYGLARSVENVARSLAVLGPSGRPDPSALAPEASGLLVPKRERQHSGKAAAVDAGSRLAARPRSARSPGCSRGDRPQTPGSPGGGPFLPSLDGQSIYGAPGGGGNDGARMRRVAGEALPRCRRGCAGAGGAFAGAAGRRRGLARHPGCAGALPAAAARAPRKLVHAPQVPDHASAPARRGLVPERGRPRHAPGPLPAHRQPRRAAGAVERPPGGHEPGRPTAAAPRIPRRLHRRGAATPRGPPRADRMGRRQRAEHHPLPRAPRAGRLVRGPLVAGPRPADPGADPHPSAAPVRRDRLRGLGRARIPARAARSHRPEAARGRAPIPPGGAAGGRR